MRFQWHRNKARSRVWRSCGWCSPRVSGWVDMLIENLKEKDGGIWPNCNTN